MNYINARKWDVELPSGQLVISTPWAGETDTEVLSVSVNGQLLYPMTIKELSTFDGSVFGHPINYAEAAGEIFIWPKAAMYMTMTVWQAKKRPVPVLTDNFRSHLRARLREKMVPRRLSPDRYGPSAASRHSRH